MSARGTRNFVAARPRVSQIFKKRNDLVTADIPINSNGTLIGNFTLNETGTLYAVKLSLHAFSEGGAAGDVQRILIWIRCAPPGTSVPDLTNTAEMNNMNGFPAAALMAVGGFQSGLQCYLNEKFRYRRKCDDQTVVELFGQSTTVQGTGRVVNINGIMSAVIRMR